MRRPEPVRQVTVVGASLAGARAVAELRRRGFDGEITLVGEEPVAPYRRPALSKSYLAGTQGDIKLALGAEFDADVRLGTRAVSLDTAARVLRLRSPGGAESEHPFDSLVIATGARARRPPFWGVPGVHVLRGITDAEALRADLSVGGPQLVVIGAGFVGSEVAATGRKLGLDVTIVEAARAPMERALGPEPGRALIALHREHGTKLRLGTGVAGLDTNSRTGRVSAVRLADGTLVRADVVVAAVGVTPAVEWLNGSGLRSADGVVCTESLTVLGARGAPVHGIVAAGDVARWPHPRYGESMRVEHWQNAVLQGEAAARTILLGHDAPGFDAVSMFWSDQYDTKIQLLGHPRQGDDFALIEGDLTGARFVAAYGRGGRVSGVLLLNSPHRLRSYWPLVTKRADFPPRSQGHEAGLDSQP